MGEGGRAGRGARAGARAGAPLARGPVPAREPAERGVVAADAQRRERVRHPPLQLPAAPRRAANSGGPSQHRVPAGTGRSRVPRPADGAARGAGDDARAAPVHARRLASACRRRRGAAEGGAPVGVARAKAAGAVAVGPAVLAVLASAAAFAEAWDFLSAAAACARACAVDESREVESPLFLRRVDGARWWRHCRPLLLVLKGVHRRLTASKGQGLAQCGETARNVAPAASS
jgi:hypothetical protein